MDSTLKARLLFILLIGWFPQLNANELCNNLTSLSWLIGDWQTPNGKITTFEQWRKVSDSTFEGTGWSSRVNGDVISSESMRLVLMSERVYFIAKVGHNPLPVAFKASGCSPTTVRFQNAKHDFPTSLTYNLVKPDHLNVSVTGNDGKGFTLKFTRIKEE